VTGGTRAEDLLRQLAPGVLGVLLRRHGQLDLCEDAVQDALVEASIAWRKTGIPESPRGWLLTVANRRLIDRVRSESARRRREEQLLVGSPPSEVLGMLPDGEAIDRDDSLALLFMCCHPALTPTSQIALTLRAVGGLTTSEIAIAFFVPEATMAQRISRAKQQIRDAGATFSMPPESELGARLLAVMHVLYLTFNEGYTSTSGDSINRVEISDEAIRLTRELARLLPDDTEVAGLLSLMLLTDARRAARTSADGDLIDLADQDRSKWDRIRIEEGVALVTEALAKGPIGAYQIQAAISALHDESPTAEATDWAQIVALYVLLEAVAPNPMATLNRAVAVAMLNGPAAGLALIASLEGGTLANHHRLFAVRGHLMEMSGDRRRARDAFEEALRRTTSNPEKRYFQRRIDGLVDY
jgi:RNA polymerase sigma factor (sigma-70 family)